MFALEYSSSNDLPVIINTSAKQIILAFSTKSNRLLTDIIKIMVQVLYLVVHHGSLIEDYYMY